MTARPRHLDPLTLYNLFFPVFKGTARLISFWSTTLETFFSVRKGWALHLANQLRSAPAAPTSFKLWVHASSVGEFEQARPLIEALREQYPDMALYLSFLSDSGYNARKGYPGAKAVFYHPVDSRHEARHLLELIKPDMLLLMRYDFWPNHLFEARKAGVTLILAAAALPARSSYFKPLLLGFYRQLFGLFDTIYTVSGHDTTLFQERFGCTHVQTAGDPRFDQVIKRSRNIRQSQKLDKIAPRFSKHVTLVAGSIWEEDEELLLPAWMELKERPHLILVPHKVDQPNIERLCTRLRQLSLPWQTSSTMNAAFDPEKELLVIDETGYLVELYSIASIAYVGGGFGINVHNTLEPAVYGIPVLFGPHHHKSPEAEELVTAGGAMVMNHQEEIARTLELLTTQRETREKYGTAAGMFVKEKSGATALMMATGFNDLKPKTNRRL